MEVQLFPPGSWNIYPRRRKTELGTGGLGKAWRDDYVRREGMMMRILRKVAVNQAGGTECGFT